MFSFSLFKHSGMVLTTWIHGISHIYIPGWDCISWSDPYIELIIYKALCSKFCMSLLIQLSALSDRYYYDPHYTDEISEAQKSLNTLPKITEQGQELNSGCVTESRLLRADWSSFRRKATVTTIAIRAFWPCCLSISAVVILSSTPFWG